MKKFVTLLFVIQLYAINVYSQHPYKQKLRNLATITFPDTPQIKINKNVKLFLVRNTHALYLAQAESASIGLRDLFSKDNIDSVYVAYMKGFASSSRGKVFYKRNIKVNSLKGLEFGCKINKGTKNYYSYNRIFYLNEALVSFSFMCADSLKNNDKKINNFFDTFKLIIPQDQIRQNNAEELSYKAGKLFGYFLILGFIAMIGFGIVFLIKKLTYS